MQFQVQSPSKCFTSFLNSIYDSIVLDKRLYNYNTIAFAVTPALVDLMKNQSAAFNELLGENIM